MYVDCMINQFNQKRLISNKTSQTCILYILQRYIVMTHREHCKTFKNLGLKYVEKYKYKTMQTNEAQYTNIMRFTKIKSTQGSQSTSYP